MKQILKQWKRRALSPFKNIERRIRSSRERFVLKTLEKHQVKSVRPTSPAMVGTSEDGLSMKTVLGFIQASQRSAAHRRVGDFQTLSVAPGLFLVPHPEAGFCYISFSNPATFPSMAMVNYQAEAADFLREHITTGSHVVQLGAEHGYHTLTIAKHCGPQGSVSAIEIDHQLHSILRLNIEAQQLDSFARVPRVTAEPRSLLSYLRSLSTMPDMIYITRDSDIPGAWLDDLETYVTEQPSVVVAIGASIATSSKESSTTQPRSPTVPFLRAA